jgi:hypothetical protein
VHVLFTVGAALGAQVMRMPTRDEEVLCEISKEMSSLYFRLAVLCLFEARVPEFGTQSFSPAIVGHRWRKNIGWIDTENQLTAHKKTSIRSMVFKRKDSIEKIFFLKLMIDTIGQK